MVHNCICLTSSSRQTQRKRRLQRKLAKQKKGSKKRARTKLQINKLSARQADRRKDWIEVTTTALIQDYDFIAIEDLQIKNMVRSASGTIDNPGKNVSQKTGLNREILNQSWSLFRKRLQDNAVASEVEVKPVKPQVYIPSLFLMWVQITQEPQEPSGLCL